MFVGRELELNSICESLVPIEGVSDQDTCIIGSGRDGKDGSNEKDESMLYGNLRPLTSIHRGSTARNEQQP
jgi:hypothetical protein